MSDKEIAGALRSAFEDRAAFEARRAQALRELEQERGSQLNLLIAQAEASGVWEGDELRTLLNERIEALRTLRGNANRDPGSPDRLRLKQRYYDMVALEVSRAAMMARSSS